MSHEAQALAVAGINKSGNNFTVGLFHQPTLINPFVGLQKPFEQPLVNTAVVAHVQADSSGNIAVVIRAGPVKLGPFYGTVTSGSPTMTIDLKLEAKSPSSTISTSIPILVGKVYLTFIFTTNAKALQIKTDTISGMLLGAQAPSSLPATTIFSFQ